MTSTPIIDLHIHSTIKPYGNSFYSNTNIKQIGNSACIWTKDKFTILDERDEVMLGVSRYRQADFTTVSQSQHHIVCVSLYPIEKGFTMMKKGSALKTFENFIIQFASQLGKNRIADVKSAEYNYYKDFNKEFAYLMTLNNQAIDSGKKYQVINKLSDLNSGASLFVIPTVEGGHFLCEGNDPKIASSYRNLSNNIKNLKDNPNPLFFVTLAHHFFNGLCTHSKSLYGTVGTMLDQTYGMRENGFAHKDFEKPITDLGQKAIDLLLTKNVKGVRILIDVKHMSKEARTAYYLLLSNKYKDEKIPIIYSHGALNIFGDDIIQINLDYDDLRAIYKSNGIIGIEIDQRILGYKDKGVFKKLKSLWRFGSKAKKAYKEAFYFWRQIISIAEYAYSSGHSDDPWKCIALGTDYDGIINPLDSFRDSSSISMLYIILIDYLEDYWNENPIVPKNHNGKDAHDVIFQIMYKNGYNFIKKHYLDPLVAAQAIV